MEHERRYAVLQRCFVKQLISVRVSLRNKESKLSDSSSGLQINDDLTFCDAEISHLVSLPDKILKAKMWISGLT